MKKLKTWLSSPTALFVLLGALGAMAVGAAFFALAPSFRALPAESPASSASVVERNTTSQKAPPESAGESTGDNSAGAPLPGTAGAHRGGENVAEAEEFDDFSQWLQEAYNTAADSNNWQQDTTDWQLQNVIRQKIFTLDEEISALKEEKLSAAASKDLCVAGLENDAATADDDLVAATADLKKAERMAPQLLAIGENPYIAIQEAENRRQGAILRAKEARLAIESALAEYARLSDSLEERLTLLLSQKRELEQQLAALG